MRGWFASIRSGRGRRREVAPACCPRPVSREERSRMPKILVTNDDGIYSEGLAKLAEAVAPFGEVVVVAPDREQSAVSHALTLNRPLRLQEISERRWIVDGTPTD